MVGENGNKTTHMSEGLLLCWFQFPKCLHCREDSIPVNLKYGLCSCSVQVLRSAKPLLQQEGVGGWIAHTRILHGALLRVSSSICFRQLFLAGARAGLTVCSKARIAACSLAL